MSKKEENKLPFSISSTKKKIKKLQKLGWKGSLLLIVFFILLGAMVAYYQRGYQSKSHQDFSNRQLQQSQKKLTVDSISHPYPNPSSSKKKETTKIGEAISSDRGSIKGEENAMSQAEVKARAKSKPEASIPQMSSESVSSQFNNLTKPLVGEIVSNCEWYKDPLLDAWKYNPGVNIQGEIGSQIKAVQAGKVSKIIRDDYQGLTIVITHNERYSSAYANLEKASVKTGEEVTKKQTIGELGDSGASDKSELHFEIIKKGETVNPMDYFN